MEKIENILGESDIKTLIKAKKNNKSSRGRELINNLVYRLNRRDNTMIEMKGFFVERVRIPMPCNAFNPNSKGLYIWAHPFPQGNFLMLKIESPAMFAGQTIRASKIFGDSINMLPPRNMDY